MKRHHHPKGQIIEDNGIFTPYYYRNDGSLGIFTTLEAAVKALDGVKIEGGWKLEN